MRKRKIRKIGNSYYVKLEQTDMKDMDLEVGDYVIIERESKKKEQSTDSILGKHPGCGKNTGEYTHPCGTYIGNNGYDYTILCKDCSQFHGNKNTGHLRDITGHSHKTSNQNHPTKQTIQKGRGDVLNKDVDSVASVELKTGDLNSRRRTG